MISAKQFPSDNANHQMNHLKKRLDAWRKAHMPRSRLPKRLWNAAVRDVSACIVTQVERQNKRPGSDLHKDSLRSHID
jgi:hypothetical protein